MSEKNTPEKKIVTQSVEFIEFAVKDLHQASQMYEKMGFSCVGWRSEPGRKSKLYKQGDIQIVLSASSREDDPVSKFSKKHGDGVWNVGYRVKQAEEAFSFARQKDVPAAIEPEVVSGLDGAAMHRAAVHVYGDVLNDFVAFDAKSKFEDLFPEERVPSQGVKGRFLQTIDHVTVNVEKGQVDRWADFYRDLFGFHQVRFFDIRTERTGLISRAMRNENGRVTMPFNEPTNPQSQIQEFIDTFHGPGVQHVAFHASDILTTLRDLRGKGFKFLSVPDTYYDAVPKRVPNVTEDMKELMELGILVDGSDKGYLLQIFTENLVGPFFYEFIQRKGDNGFGDGNFRALFEAIERDQIRRGVLK